MCPKSNEIQCSRSQIAIPGSTIFILLIITLQCSAETTVYQTSSTHCTITFSEQAGSLEDGEKKTFQKCEMRICRKYDIRGGCRQEDIYVLEESKCYWDCCRSETYDWRQCEDYNEEFAIRQQSSNRHVIIALAISFSIVLVAVTIFICKYMKCWAKKEEVECLESGKGSNYSEKQAEWKKSGRQFTVEDKQCKICGMKEAFVMHSCGQFYHLKCLQEIKDNWQCKKCSKSIQKLRLYCIVCLNRFITMKAESFEEFEDKVMRSYESHPQNQCFELMRVELDTERKLTATTHG